jgi:hypothetical protein
METTMAATEEHWIKHRAYELWEQEGYPSGKDQEHWERAKLEYATLHPTASNRAVQGENGSAPGRKTATVKAEKPASKAVSAKRPAAKTAASTTKATAKPKAEKTAKPAVAASASTDQTKKRPKKAAAE